ncbi:MAG: diguanylate cyclase, partial [Giesbergeria sp.]
ALLSWLLARRLSEDLHNLARAASTVNAGAHEAAIPLRGSSREVFELSSAMAHMTARMLQANDEMEEQVRLRTQQLEQANQELDRQARTDALTGLLNRRGFEAHIGFALALAARNLQPLSVVTFDVDHFKRINDRYGHAVGDAVLQRLARLLPEHLRASDIVARVGGEEFVALLPSTDTAGAMKVAQALLDAVAATADPDVGQLTLSAGVASLRNLQDTRAALLQRSDEALYTAKQAGRNRVRMTP